MIEKSVSIVQETCQEQVEEGTLSSCSSKGKASHKSSLCDFAYVK